MDVAAVVVEPDEEVEHDFDLPSPARPCLSEPRERDKGVPLSDFPHEPVMHIFNMGLGQSAGAGPPADPPSTLSGAHTRYNKCAMFTLRHERGNER